MDFSSELSLLIFTALCFFPVAAIVYVLLSGELESGNDFETRRLYFAAVVLTGLSIIFIFCTGLYFLSPGESSAGKEIFNAAKTIIPPIVTLVLGYYFGQEKQNGELPPKAKGKNAGVDESTEMG